MPYFSSETLDTLVAQIRRLAEEVAGMRADLQRHGIGQATDADEALIEAAHAAMGSKVFRTSDLLVAALRRDAGGTRVASLVAGKTPGALGKALGQAAEKRSASGLVLRRVSAPGASVADWCIGV